MTSLGFWATIIASFTTIFCGGWLFAALRALHRQKPSVVAGKLTLLPLALALESIGVLIALALSYKPTTIDVDFITHRSILRIGVGVVLLHLALYFSDFLNGKK